MVMMGKQMNKIDETAKAKISDSIAKVERQCESELVCLITRRSARYVLFPLLMAALTALFMPILGAFSAVEISFTHQVVLFVILAGMFVFTPLSHKLTPKWLKHQNCSRYSVEQFFRQRLHETKSRNAILIFVSWEEKFVTVVADQRINEKVQQNDWDKLVSDFTHNVKTGEIEQGFLQIVSGAGEMLTKFFPVKAAKKDELPNHLIELDEPGYLS
jgi:putative membrane protein